MAFVENTTVSCFARSLIFMYQALCSVRFLRDPRQGRIVIVSNSSTSSVSMPSDLLISSFQYLSCHLGCGFCRRSYCRLCGRLAASCACLVREIESADWSDVLFCFDLAAEEVAGGIRPVHVPVCDLGRYFGCNLRRATTLSLCPTRPSLAATAGSDYGRVTPDRLLLRQSC